MTPTIFDSTVGYPSDSLASCMTAEIILQTLQVSIVQNIGSSQSGLSKVKQSTAHSFAAISAHLQETS